jgi:hypothetical protein
VLKIVEVVIVEVLEILKIWSVKNTGTLGATIKVTYFPYNDLS